MATLDLTDQNDADYAALNDERVSVPLTGLDGSGYLRGTWAIVVTSRPATRPTRPTAPTTTRATTTASSRSWPTTGSPQSQLYLRSLGFGVTPGWPAINADQQRVRINQWGVDNSFATDHPKDEMRFGKGGVDDAEDAEVILHELGHQIHFSQSATFFAIERGGLDQRGLRRLLGRRCQRDRGRRPARSGVHRRVGLRQLHGRSRPLPAPA